MKLTADDIAYLRQKASQYGHNADDLLKVMNYESSGDPSRWGGKGGDYFGLIQFGPNERKQFGVDTQNPNAQNQIDATFNFLSARGFKPGMPLMDLYSTVLAGSPGHYNAKDMNGSVASHVANMTGQAPMQLPGANYQLPASMQPYAVGEGLGQSTSSPAQSEQPQLKQVAKLAGLLSPQEENPIIAEGPMVQHLRFNGYIPKAKLAGLLGR